MRAVLILTRGVQTFKDEGEMLYIVMLYSLTILIF